MPVTKSAIKKARQDLKRMLRNKRFKERLKSAIRNFLKNNSAANFRIVQSLVDKAVKKGIYKKNKAARVKSRLAKIQSPTSTKPRTKLQPSSSAPNKTTQSRKTQTGQKASQTSK